MRNYNYLENIKQNLKLHIDKFPKDFLLSQDEEEIVKNLIEKFKIDNLKIFEENISRDPSEEIEIDVRNDPFRDIRDRSRPFLLKGTKIRIYVPYRGKHELFSIQPSTVPFHVVKAIVDTEDIAIDYEFLPQSTDVKELNSRIKRDLDFIKTMIQSQNSEIEHFNNSELPKLVESTIKNRRDKLQKENLILDSLNFPLKRKEDTKIPIPLERSKRSIVSYEIDFPKSEPFLDYSEYEYIIKIINRLGESLEKCSQTVRDMNEEDLRLLFLVILNTHYENQATGETFNKEGKTDILIKPKDRNIFIAECKIWKGEKLFLDGIDQLLKYLSWRDTKTSYIIFCKNRDFTNVIKKVYDIIKSHPNFVREVKIVGETCKIYKFRQVNDPKKEIYLTSHLFNVPAD